MTLKLTLTPTSVLYEDVYLFRFTIARANGGDDGVQILNSKVFEFTVKSREEVIKYCTIFNLLADFGGGPLHDFESALEKNGFERDCWRYEIPPEAILYTPDDGDSRYLHYLDSYKVFFYDFQGREYIVTNEYVD